MLGSGSDVIYRLGLRKTPWSFIRRVRALGGDFLNFTMEEEKEKDEEEVAGGKFN